MKIKFDAQKLVEQIHLAKAALPAPMKTSSEESLGIRAVKAIEGMLSDKLIVYAFAKNQWARIVIPGEVEEDGVIFVNRQRFFNLLGVLKGEIKLQTSGTQIKLTTNEQAGKFSMVTSIAIVPKPNTIGTSHTVMLDAKPLFKQLQQCTLDEELAGGGFKVSFGETLDILSTDRVRLIDTHQKINQVEKFEMVIASESIKGVTEVLKIAEGKKVEITAASNITSWLVENEGGSFEYGSVNIAMPFPNVKQIVEAKGYTNAATLDVADTLEAVRRVTVLADDELAWGDFDFSTPEICTITAEAVQGLSEVTVDSKSEIDDERMSVLRLQLGHVQSFMTKAKAQGVETLFVEWGERLPVKFTPNKYEKALEIDVKFICAALQRKAKEASNGQSI